jgi:hypothetical protein
VKDIEVTKYLATDEAIFERPLIHDHVPRRAVDNIGQIKQWLNTCNLRHQKCSIWSPVSSSTRKNPSRVLEIIPSGLRVRCDVSNIVDLSYLTLSHI